MLFHTLKMPNLTFLANTRDIILIECMDTIGFENIGFIWISQLCLGRS